MARRYIPAGQLVRIAITIVLLVAVVVMKQRCGKAAIEMFRAFDIRGDGGAMRTSDGGIGDGGAKALTPVDAAH
jgi:hypothetical protein